VCVYSLRYIHYVVIRLQGIRWECIGWFTIRIRLPKIYIYMRHIHTLRRAAPRRIYDAMRRLWGDADVSDQSSCHWSRDRQASVEPLYTFSDSRYIHIYIYIHTSTSGIMCCQSNRSGKKRAIEERLWKSAGLFLFDICICLCINVLCIRTRYAIYSVRQSYGAASMQRDWEIDENWGLPV